MSAWSRTICRNLPQAGHPGSLLRGRITTARPRSEEDSMTARVIAYCENDYNVLADAFAARHLDGAGEYYLSLPALTHTDTSTPPRATWPRPAAVLEAGEFGGNP